MKDIALYGKGNELKNQNRMIKNNQKMTKKSKNYKKDLIISYGCDILYYNYISFPLY